MSALGVRLTTSLGFVICGGYRRIELASICWPRLAYFAAYTPATASAYPTQYFFAACFMSTSRDAAKANVCAFLG